MRTENLAKAGENNMSMSDPIADMCTRIRNGAAARHPVVRVPASKLKQSIADVLQREGFIAGYSEDAEGPRRYLNLKMRYREDRSSIVGGIRRVSRPGLRVYVARQEIPRVYGGLGIAIMSTPQGVMTGQEAWRRQMGGEILCYVW